MSVFGCSAIVLSKLTVLEHTVPHPTTVRNLALKWLLSSPSLFLLVAMDETIPGQKFYSFCSYRATLKTGAKSETLFVVS